jgi:hypothetical protein
MKLMFNKITLEGHWFEDDEMDNNYTENIPVDTNQIFDEEQNDWILKPSEDPPISGMIKEEN